MSKYRRIGNCKYIILCDLLASVWNFFDNPTKNNFDKIVDNVGNDQCRGGINIDNIDIHDYDVVNLACVKKGLRQCCYFPYHTNNILKPIYENMNCIKLKNGIIVYNDQEKANKLKDFFSHKFIGDQNEKHRTFGRLLGYPTDDIEYFIRTDRKLYISQKIATCRNGCITESYVTKMIRHNKKRIIKKEILKSINCNI